MPKVKKASKIIDFIFETRLLRNLKRSGLEIFLAGPIQQSVSEHAFLSSLISLVMCLIDKTVDVGKVLSISITHDLEEVRTGDINQVNKMYISENERFNAFRDLVDPLDFKASLLNLYKERREERTEEAKVARDADILAEAVLEKENLDVGHRYAKEWVGFTVQRLQTKVGKELGKEILKTDSHRWFQNLLNQIRRRYGIKEKDYSGK